MLGIPHTFGNTPGPPRNGGNAKSFFFEETLAGIAVKSEAIAVVRGKDDEGVASVRRCAKGVHDAADFGVNHFDHAVILIDVILPIAARPLASTGPPALGVFVVEIARKRRKVALNFRCKSVFARAAVGHGGKAAVVRVEESNA